MSREIDELLADEHKAIRRAEVLRSKLWPLKDIAAKLTEEGHPAPGFREKWNVAAVKEALQRAKSILTQDEMEAWLTRVGAAVDVLREVIRDLPDAHRDSAGNGLFVACVAIQHHAIQQATSLDDGESLRRLHPGVPGLAIRPTRAGDAAEFNRMRRDPDSHTAWLAKRERKRGDLKVVDAPDHTKN